MNFDKISKLIINGEKIQNIKLKVCYYARVSTSSNNQLNSLDNQTDYYYNYIKSNPNWIYVKGYIDEGLSGIRVEKRIAFKQMIDDAKLGKFDLIITKEVSRFARDLEDSIHYIRILKECNVGVFFENQNLNTFDINSELILNIMFNLAQEESKKLSYRIKFGHNEAIKKGHVLGSSNIIGYRKNNCKLVIVEKEATLVKKIFELYATGDYGLYKLSKLLAKKGYYNKNGNYYDKDTLKRIISNPKYKGYYRGKTSEVIDYRTKKRIMYKEKEQIIYKSNNDIIPAIVSEELWNKANEILNKRTKKYNYSHNYSGGLKYPFSSKIYCKMHNVTFQRSNKKRPIWCCSKYLKYRLDACASPIILEKDLYNIMNNIMNKLIINKNKIVDDLIKIYESNDEEYLYDQEIKNINQQIDLIENKKNMLLDLVINGELSKEELKHSFQKYQELFLSLKKEKERINNQKELLKNNQDFIKLINEEITNGCLDGFIRNFVSKIIVDKIDNDRNNIKLDIYLDLLDKSLKESILFINNKKELSIEHTNKYTYSVYINQ